MEETKELLLLSTLQLSAHSSDVKGKLNVVQCASAVEKKFMQRLQLSSSHGSFAFKADVKCFVEQTHGNFHSRVSLEVSGDNLTRDAFLAKMEI